MSRLQAAFDRADSEVEYRADCERIQSIVGGMGANISLRMAERIWRWHSDRMAAGWLSLGDDADIMAVVQRFLGDCSPTDDLIRE